MSNKIQKKMKILSLFANIGVAEAYLKNVGFDVVLANELIEQRATLYSKIYPETKMICGDITNKNIFDKIINESIDMGVDIIMATPPCQGMSTAGQQNEDDERNRLICQVIEIIKRVLPKYVFIENVPQFYSTQIVVNGRRMRIPDYISAEIGNRYNIKQYVIDTKNYSVPQTRKRAIMLITRMDVQPEWVCRRRIPS